MISGFSFLSFALKNLGRKPFRTGVLVLSIALLVSLLVFSLSFVISVGSSLKKAADRLGADLTVVPVGARGSAEAFLLESREASFYMDKTIADRVKRIEGVEQITYQTYLTTISGLCCDVAQTRIVAFNQDTDFIVMPWLQGAIGRRLKKGEAIAGYETNYNLGLELLEVEKTIYNNKFRIVGVLEQTGTGLDNALFMDEENLKYIIGSGKSPLKEEQISIIFAKIKKGLDPYEVGRRIEGEIVEVDVVARNDMGKEMLKTLKDINRIFLVSVVLTTILSVFLVWSIFSAIANERSREVGIMRALGAKGSHIVTLFVIEVSLIGVMGSAIGMGAGTWLSLSLAKGFSLLKSVSASLTVSQHAVIALAGLAAGIFICITGALLPISQIKKREPLLAIKEE